MSGRYRVEAEAAGFQKAASPEFTLNSGTRPRLDLALTLGALSENVQVTALAPLVNATTTELGVVVDRAKMDVLMLNGRNFQQLATLVPGVSSVNGTNQQVNSGSVLLQTLELRSMRKKLARQSSPGRGTPASGNAANGMVTSTLQPASRSVRSFRVP